MAAYSKLSIINTCLILTGNSPVNVEEDGSDEWTVGSAAYEDSVTQLLAAHDWKFATRVTQPARADDSPDSDFDDAYPKPVNSLGIVWVKVDGSSIDYKIIGNRICANAPDGIDVKDVVQPGPEDMPPLFVGALQCWVKSGLASGLNEDPDEARRLRAEGQALLDTASSRSDREEPRPVPFRSRMLARRKGTLTTTE